MSVDPAELGYVFYPFTEGFSIGYAELEVFVSDSDGKEGFVPVELVVATWDDTGVVDDSDLGSSDSSSGASIGRTTIFAHTDAGIAGDVTHRVAPGFVTVQGKSGGELSAYCFGGSLVYRQAGKGLACRLTSSAPIFNLSEEGLDWSENSILRIVDGLESEIATLRAQIDGDSETAFDQRLAHTNPRLLYAAGLDLAYRSFQALPEVLRTEHYWDQYSTLVRAHQEARQSDWWPADPSLPAVLGTQI
ncbi:MAG: hypothetical protein U0X20_20745 [Caldilineaceae bacterium]